MQMQKHWYLGFLSLIGLYELPKLLGFFQGTGAWSDLTAAFWVLWGLYFLPENGGKEDL